MNAISASHSRAAVSATVASTGGRSKVERLMTFSTSLDHPIPRSSGGSALGRRRRFRNAPSKGIDDPRGSSIADSGRPGFCPKAGGVLKVYHRDSPAGMSVLEEASLSTSMPMMAVFNNLILYDQHVAQNSLASIGPDLATSWSRSEDGTQLIFKLRSRVQWHDGKPFTAADVKCT
jgi:ABC-type transport system substrate-binding protein